MTNSIALRNLGKSFAAPVLKDVCLDVSRGSIHGLVGENGAGKTTLINIVSGLLDADADADADAGQIELDGKPFSARTRREALNAGIALASQELSLIEPLSVAENILLAELPRNALTVDRPEVRQRAQGLMDLVGLDEVAPSAPSTRSTNRYRPSTSWSTPARSTASTTGGSG